MSCLFQSLALYVQPNGHEIIRSTICDFLLTNPKLIDDMNASEIIAHETNVSLEDYVKAMRQYSSMGGAIEIRSFTKIFNKNVRVFSIPNKKMIEFIENPMYDFCGLVWNGGHFDPATFNDSKENTQDLWLNITHAAPFPGRERYFDGLANDAGGPENDGRFDNH